ncbi:unnamed protein product [Caenorhabditis nigoni]
MLKLLTMRIVICAAPKSHGCCIYLKISVDSLALAYALISLVLAENAYGDGNSESEDVSEYWKKAVLVEKSMKKDYGMMMISSLTGDESFRKSLFLENEIPEDELQLLSKIYTNHLEFFSNTLHQSNCVELLANPIESGLQLNQYERIGKAPFYDLRKRKPPKRFWQKCEEDKGGWNVGREILKNVPMNALDRLVKGAKGLDNIVEKVLKSVKKSADEKNAPKKFANRTAAEVIEKLESSDLSVDESIELLEGVHVAETKKDVFDAVVKYVEELPGGESLSEMKLFKLLIEMYGGSTLESLALQVVFSRIAADGWTDFDRTPGTEKSEESWFAVLAEMIDFLDVAMKTATEIERGFILRRHKLSLDVARLVDRMKRNESYFSMLAASIIGDAVFYGSDSLLAMSKLHSLADKNASGLLATNLPAVERTRYNKFLSTITRASKRVY